MTKGFNVSFPEPLARQLDRAAKREGASRSELLRSLASGYLKRMKTWDEISQDVRRAGKRMGVATMNDVDQLVHEVRAEESDQ